MRTTKPCPRCSDVVNGQTVGLPHTMKAGCDQRAEQIERLIRAIDYFRENPPNSCTRPTMRAIANRFAVHPKTFENAVKMMVEEGILL